MAKEHLVNDDTVKATNEILSKMLSSIREVNGTGVTEYGTAYVIGQESTDGYRCYRKNGVLTMASSTLNGDSTFPYKYSSGAGTTACVNSYKECTDFPNFNPQKVTSRAGTFKRIERFYYGTQYIGVYMINWVCAEKLYDWYKLPRDFYWKGELYWNYVDIGCYEGAEERIDGTNYLVSKVGYHPAHNRTRTQFETYAENWHSLLSTDTDKEFYHITTISEWTEILTPIIEILLASRNAQNTTTGYMGSCYLYERYCPIAGYEVDEDAGTTTLYIQQYTSGSTSYDTTIRTGGSVNLCTASSSSDEGTGVDEHTDSAYAQCLSATKSSGTINDTSYTHIIVIDKVIDGAEGYTRVNSHPWKTGECDYDYTNTYAWRNSGNASCLNGDDGCYENAGYYPFKILGIENVWGNMWKNILNVTIQNYVPYVCTDISNWTDTTTPETNSYFEQVNYSVCTKSSSYVTEIGEDSEHSDVKLPTAVGGASNKYYADYYWISSSYKTCYAGGPLVNGLYDGLFCFNLNNAVGNSNWNNGARLSL
ncbi:MAG: hypothetical protein LUD27_00690 [Clostridia bacterium]|nr:hypothetical protein [Clostridia bacterium]